MMRDRKVVVTGIGVVSPVGSSRKRFWKSLLHGVSGIGPITHFDASAFDTRFAGLVDDFNIDAVISKKEQRRINRFGQFALGAAIEAMEDAGLNMDIENPERCGAIVGSGVGGLDNFELQHANLLDNGPSRMSVFTIPQMICNMASGLIAIRFNLQGPNYAVNSACATSTHSIGEAMRLIQRNDADVMLAGGAEAAITATGIGGFSALKALSTRNDEPQRASRPFDAERDGFVMGEGAGVLVLEAMEHARARGANIYCEVAGYGMSCDAYHMTAPAKDGVGAARAMKLAMQDAQCPVEHVDYINAHGSSTLLNDNTETQAIKTAFGLDKARQVAVSSTKSMTGHLLGAAGGVESAACALAIRDSVVPPTINYEHADPNCDLDYVPNEVRERRLKAVLNNSFGFGGHNACLLFRALP